MTLGHIISCYSRLYHITLYRFIGRNYWIYWICRTSLLDGKKRNGHFAIDGDMQFIRVAVRGSCGCRRGGRRGGGRGRGLRRISQSLVWLLSLLLLSSLSSLLLLSLVVVVVVAVVVVSLSLSLSLLSLVLSL